MEKDAGGNYTEYVFDQAGPEGEYNRTAWVDTWVSFEGRHFAHFSNGDTYFVHADRIGTTNIVTDWNTGTVIQDELHYPWGQVWTSAGSSIEERFAGLQYRDEETSLDPTPNRMYSSDEGRWLIADPMRSCPYHPENFNRYNYTSSNPVNRIDPNGTFVNPVLGYDEFDLIDMGIEPTPPFYPPAACVLCNAACAAGYATYIAGCVSAFGIRAGTGSMGGGLVQLYRCRQQAIFGFQHCLLNCEFGPGSFGANF